MIQRITMFKVPDDSNIQPILDQYKIVESSAQKEGKPYILECAAHQTMDDPRRQGYKVVAMTKFESIDDMKYYDEQCEAHKQLKQFNTGKIEVPPFTAYMEV